MFKIPKKNMSLGPRRVRSRNGRWVKHLRSSWYTENDVAYLSDSYEGNSSDEDHYTDQYLTEYEDLMDDRCRTDNQDGQDGIPRCTAWGRRNAVRLHRIRTGGGRHDRTHSLSVKGVPYGPDNYSLDRWKCQSKCPDTTPEQQQELEIEYIRSLRRGPAELGEMPSVDPHTLWKYGWDRNWSQHELDKSTGNEEKTAIDTDEDEQLQEAVQFGQVSPDDETDGDIDMLRTGMTTMSIDAEPVTIADQQREIETARKRAILSRQGSNFTSMIRQAVTDQTDYISGEIFFEREHYWEFGVLNISSLIDIESEIDEVMEFTKRNRLKDLQRASESLLTELTFLKTCPEGTHKQEYTPEDRTIKTVPEGLTEEDETDSPLKKRRIGDEEQHNNKGANNNADGVHVEDKAKQSGQHGVEVADDIKQHRN